MIMHHNLIELSPQEYPQEDRCFPMLIHMGEVSIFETNRNKIFTLFKRSFKLR